MIERKQITAANLDPNELSKRSQVLQVVPFASATLTKMVDAGTFPAPIKMTSRLHVWKNSEILEWLETVTNE